MPDLYYYNLLGKTEQRAYYSILDGLQSAAASFAVPNLPSDALSEIFTFVRLDHPGIFYAPTFSYRFSRGADSVEFIPDYLFRKKQILEHREAVAARTRKLTAPAVSLDALGKERYIHDFICRNVRYDKLKKPYSHEVIGPLTQGVGVCEGIAKTVKLLCDQLGLPCVVAFSENAPEKGIRFRHAWNIVTIAGNRYHLDATFDNTLSSGGTVRYDYFNLGDSAVFRDHERLVWRMPPCPDNSSSWYIRNRLSFTRTEDVRKRASQAARKKAVFIFHWRGGALNADIIETLCGLLFTAASENNCSLQLSFNRTQAVFQAVFRTEPAPEAVREEVVNEAESSACTECSPDIPVP